MYALIEDGRIVDRRSRAPTDEEGLVVGDWRPLVVTERPLHDPARQRETVEIVIEPDRVAQRYVAVPLSLDELAQMACRRLEEARRALETRADDRSAVHAWKLALARAARSSQDPDAVALLRPMAEARGLTVEAHVAEIIAAARPADARLALVEATCDRARRLVRAAQSADAIDRHVAQAISEMEALCST